MYLEYFGLSEQPFAITPNTRYLYQGKTHEQALATLSYGVQEHLGFLLLTGEVGTGKTTLIRALLDLFDEKVHTALLFNPLLSVPELLCTITRDFKLATKNASPKSQIDALNKFLLRVHERGEHAVLIVDEAQDLSEEALEAIRLLTNLETNEHKLLQIILVGQPELTRKLNQHRLRQLAQRITARVQIEPLDRVEMLRYINHRLYIANGAGKVFFEPNAYRLIYRETGGCPRLVNQVCHRALLATYLREMHVVDCEAVNQALDDWRGRPAPFSWNWLKRRVFS